MTVTAISASQSHAAERLAGAMRSGIPCAPVRDLIGDSDLDAAYGVQAELTARALAAGRRIVGRKIGLTSLAVQKQLGVAQPDFGVLFADMEKSEDSAIPYASVLQPKIETEVALVLARDLTMAEPTAGDILQAIDYAVAAFEIVGSRITDWNIAIADTIADNASSGLFVLGASRRKAAEIDFPAVRMTMRRGEEVVSQGTGADCLGSPLHAAVWLAGEMVRRGEPLRAGQVILAGALGPMVPVHPGDAFHAIIEGLGDIRAVFQ